MKRIFALESVSAIKAMLPEVMNNFKKILEFIDKDKRKEDS